MSPPVAMICLVALDVVICATCKEYVFILFVCVGWQTSRTGSENEPWVWAVNEIICGCMHLSNTDVPCGVL
jgi:hypothetical protein